MSKVTSTADPTPGLVNLDLDLDVAHKIIKLAEKHGAADVEVLMVKDIYTGFSIENNSINFSSSGIEVGMGIRVIKDRRLGFGFCTDLALVENAVRNAIETSKLAKESLLEFNAKTKVNQIRSIFDPSLLELTVMDGLAIADQLITASTEHDSRVIVTGGGLGYGGGAVAIVTSTGYEFEYQATGINGGVSTLVKDKTISTGFEYEQSRRNNIDFREVGRTAAELAVMGQNPSKVEPGKYTIMFAPHALAQLLEFTVIPSLYGEPANKGETVYSGRVGEKVSSQEFTFIDDGTLENGINTAPIDDEGTPCQKNVLIEKGILKNYLFDLVSGLEFKQPSTGNAVRAEAVGSGRSYKAPPKTKALNFTIDGRHRPRGILVSDLDRALIIHDVLGAHTANPASGDFSVNSPTLFKINKGELAGPGKQVMLSGNMPELLDNITAIGDDIKDVGGGLSPVAVRIPSIVIEDVKII